MMKYVVEMDLIPIYKSRDYPITSRFLIEAEGIAAALLKVEKERYPGQDCVAIRILELES
jgi:hypothetical protein